MKQKILTTTVFFLLLVFALVLQASAQTKRINVKFRPGTSSATLTNTITGYGTADFYVRAKAGQNLFVKLNSKNGFMYFVIFKDSVDAGAFADDAREVTAYSGSLPDDGTYIVRVYMVRAEARRNKRPVSFNIKFEIN